MTKIKKASIDLFWNNKSPQKPYPQYIDNIVWVDGQIGKIDYVDDLHLRINIPMLEDFNYIKINGDGKTKYYYLQKREYKAGDINVYIFELDVYTTYLLQFLVENDVYISREYNNFNTQRMNGIGLNEIDLPFVERETIHTSWEMVGQKFKWDQDNDKYYLVMKDINNQPHYLSMKDKFKGLETPLIYMIQFDKDIENIDGNIYIYPILKQTSKSEWRYSKISPSVSGNLVNNIESVIRKYINRNKPKSYMGSFLGIPLGVFIDTFENDFECEYIESSNIYRFKFSTFWINKSVTFKEMVYDSLFPNDVEKRLIFEHYAKVKIYSQIVDYGTLTGGELDFDVSLSPNGIYLICKSGTNRISTNLYLQNLDFLDNSSLPSMSDNYEKYIAGTKSSANAGVVRSSISGSMGTLAGLAMTGFGAATMNPMVLAMGASAGVSSFLSIPTNMMSLKARYDDAYRNSPPSINTSDINTIKTASIVLSEPGRVVEILPTSIPIDVYTPSEKGYEYLLNFHRMNGYQTFRKGRILEDNGLDYNSVKVDSSYTDFYASNICKRETREIYQNVLSMLNDIIRLRK